MHGRTLVNALGVLLAVSLLVGCGGDAGEAPPQQSALETPDQAAPEATAPPDVTTLPADTPAAAAPAAAGGLDPALVEEGRQVYAGPGLCTACHGPNAQGTPLAPDLTDGEWVWIENPEQDLQTKLVTLIRTGVAQPRDYPAPMPPSGGGSLNDRQLEAVSAYVISLNQ